jgi:hypothetical protein
MNKTTSFAALLLLLFLNGCGKSDPGDDISAADRAVSVLSVPGVILLPDSAGFSELEESELDAILLYCWLPMGQYPESENDLLFLSTLEERDITPVPVQFNSAVRNASQTQLNQLGISLSVALGDDSVKNFMGVGALPAAALVRSNGSIVRAEGFGCAERVLRESQ